MNQQNISEARDDEQVQLDTWNVEADDDTYSEGEGCGSCPDQ